MNDKLNHTLQRRGLSKKTLVVAVAGAIAMAFTGGALAQEVNGIIRGQVPASANESIRITNDAGFYRVTPIDKSGKYSVTLPVGTYTVSFLQNGAVLDSHANVTAIAGTAVNVDFVGGQEKAAPTAGVAVLAGVAVNASYIPPIDTDSTNVKNTVTARDLQLLPVQRGADNIALLAPGVVPGSLLGAGGISVGGASIVENSFYIDGFNTTNPITGSDGLQLPYEAIEQQQTLTNGYGAKYGRSIGGVVTQIGKSGSNQWHYGTEVEWEPTWGQGTARNLYWENGLDKTPGKEKGDLRNYGEANKAWNTVYDAYLSGPIVKNKLFFFASAELTQSKGNTVGILATPSQDTIDQTTAQKYYSKFLWNVSDNNVVTLTLMEDAEKDYSQNNSFDYATDTVGPLVSQGTPSKPKTTLGVLNYTGYLTDQLTLHAMVGKEHEEYYTEPNFAGVDLSVPDVSQAVRQNPALTDGESIVNNQPNFSITDPRHKTSNLDYRLDLDYQIGDHTLSFGIDNRQTWDEHDGSTIAGPGYLWQYDQNDPTKPIVGTSSNIAPYVGPTDSVANGQQGYFVSKEVISSTASVHVSQTAEYVQDKWQMTPNFMLSAGLRDEQFTNYDPSGQAYIRLDKPQWAPRVGFNWNVGGSNTLDIFGNIGRYYLALPAGVALTEAGAPLFTREYFTYSGVNSDGIPTGLTPIPSNPVGAVPQNGETGQSQNPLTVSAQNIKAEYADAATLGMKKVFSNKWIFGATATLNRIGRVVDNYEDTAAICAAAVQDGYSNFAQNGGCAVTKSFINSSILINPGLTQVLGVNDPDGSIDRVILTSADQDFPAKPKRKYYALDLSLTRPWDGKWFAKIDYQFSRSYGNTEGPVDTTSSDGGDSTTEQWDYSQLMQYAGGDLPNDQAHQIKFIGAFQISPEWQVGANVYIASGHPIVCLGRYGPGQTDPLGYGNAYHWCGGFPAPPGSTGFTPWIYQLNLNVSYFPPNFHKRLKFELAGFNLLNEQRPLMVGAGYATSYAPAQGYLLPRTWESPRVLQLSASYNF